MNHTQFFNSVPIKTIATTNESNEPNLTLCGSAFMPDEQYIHIGHCRMEKTYQNILKTKRASFLVESPRTAEMWQKYHQTGEKSFCAGYRYYCSFVEESQKPEILNKVKENLASEKYSRICETMDSVLIFKVEMVREIVF